MEAYSAASKDVFAIFRDTTPLVEGLSIDEAFLEVGGLRRIVGTPEEVAVRLRERVRTEVGLAISVGVARTKFLAKVASAVSKPDGLLVVEPEREEEFLLPLPVERLWGVGAVTAEKLQRLSSAHRRAHSARLGLIARSEHDAAADDDRSAAQLGGIALLDRGVERVEVGVQHGGFAPHPVLPSTCRSSHAPGTSAQAATRRDEKAPMRCTSASKVASKAAGVPMRAGSRIDQCRSSR